jgi:capsular exopolysaccharide synthesis family protein
LTRKALEEKLKAEYGRAVRDEDTLRTALSRAKSEAVQQNQDAVQYNLLKQEADTTRALYTQFLQKTNQANIQLAEQPSNVRVIEPAEVPSSPVTSNRPLYIFLGFFASFTACVGVAFLVEHLSKTIKSVEDVNRYIQLPAIGVIPDIKAQTSRHLLSKNGRQKQAADGGAESLLGLSKFNTRPVVSFDDRSMVAEAYRAVSTSVLLSSGEAPPKTILVTSGLAGEGKTTTAVNTAISLAQFGASVLIIDCDLRNPTGHKVFNLDNSRGLSTYLSSDVELDGLISKLKIPNLSILPAGPIPHNPAKLVISRKMKLMLRTLGERYDHILIDSPPLIGVTDAIILSTIVDGVIVVVHGSKSTREIARRTRQELSNVGANIFGVVLNNIDTAEYQYYQPAYKYIDSDKEGA